MDANPHLLRRITLDGYIAGPNGQTSFFAPDKEVLELIAREMPDTIPTHLREDAGLPPRPDHFDTVVWGASPTSRRSSSE